MNEHVEQKLEQVFEFMFTGEEIAERLQISQCTLKRLYEHFGFPRPIRVGTQKRWPKVLVDRWIADQIDGQDLGLGA